MNWLRATPLRRSLRTPAQTHSPTLLFDFSVAERQQSSMMFLFLGIQTPVLMERTRSVVVAVSTLVVGVTLLSGPLVPGITLATEPEPVAFETGNVTVSEAEMPEKGSVESLDGVWTGR